MLLPAHPLVPLAIAFAVGVLLGQSAAGAAVLWAAALATLLFASRRTEARLRPAVLTAAVACGALRMWLVSGPAPDDVSHLTGTGFVTVRGAVAGDIERRDGAWTCEIAARSVTLPDGRDIGCSGRAEARLAGGPALAYGDTVEARGRLEPPQPPTNPGAFDYSAYLAHRGIYATFTAHRASAWRLTPEPPSPADLVPRIASSGRRSLETALRRLLPPAEAGVLTGILVGDRTLLPPRLDDDFAATGTAHVLATAGLHVGMVAWLLATLCRAARMGRRATAVVTILCLALFALLAGGRPSVVRAVLMADIFFAGYLLDRDPDGANSLAAAAIVLLLWQPGWLFDAGFQLSFATVGTIIAVLRVAEPWLMRLRPVSRLRAQPPLLSRALLASWRGLVNIVLLSLAAQLGSAPLVAEYFNQLHIGGVVANALIVPAMVPLIGAGFAAWAAALCCPPVAHGLAALVLSPLLRYVIGAARACALAPGAVVYVRSPGWIVISAYYLALSAGLWWLAQRRPASFSHAVVAPAGDAPARAEIA